MNIPTDIQNILDSAPVEQLDTRTQIMCALNDQVPRTDLGLQKFFYRCDLIPEDMPQYSAGEQAQILNAATVNVIYDEGYPTFTNGSAIWGMMPYESEEGFRAFKQYLTQPKDSGIRRLELLQMPLAAEEQGGVGSGPVNGQILWGMGELLGYFHQYSWLQRAKAYDMFELAAATKLRERRIMSTTDKHYLEAERLFTKVMGYFERENEETGELEWIEEMTPKVAIDMMEKLVRIQRTALGLSAHGLAKGDEHDLSPNASAEVILRQIAKQSANPDGSGSTSAAQGLDMLLNDPEAAAQAQALIIRMAGK